MNERKKTILEGALWTQYRFLQITLWHNDIVSGLIIQIQNGYRRHLIVLYRQKGEISAIKFNIDHLSVYMLLYGNTQPVSISVSADIELS